MSVGVLAGGGGREKRLAGREQMRGKGNKWWLACVGNLILMG
jgi:hypothetical protein